MTKKFVIFLHIGDGYETRHYIMEGRREALDLAEKIARTTMVVRSPDARVYVAEIFDECRLGQVVFAGDK